MALLLPSYQGAVQMRLKAEMAEQEREDGEGPSYPPPAEDDPLRYHRLAQQQPVVTTDELERLIAPAPGVGMYGTVSRVPASTQA